MSFEVLVLALRILAAVLLYLFLAVAVFVIWRDWRAVAQHVERGRETASRSLGRLLVIQGGETDLVPGESFALHTITRLGRSPTNTVIVQDPFASTEHALLSLRSGRWWLEDLGSRNGTLLNEEPLKAPAIVATGDVIGIGGVRLRIELS